MGPQLEQCGREEGETAGLAHGVRNERIGELLLHDQVCSSRGKLDRPPELVLVHRPDQDLVRGQQRCEPPVLGATPVEVRSHRDDDRGDAIGRRGGLRDGVEERGSFSRVRALREDLFELVDGQQRVLSLLLQRLTERSEGVVARADHREGPPIAARKRARSECRHEPRPQQGRLPAPRGSDQR